MEMRWHSPPMKSGFGRRVNRVHLAVAGRDDEVCAGRHHRVGIAEKIKREQREQHPQAASTPASAQNQRADDFAQKGGDQQREHGRARPADQFQRGEQGFSRVFHAVRVKFFRATCNSAFSGAS